MFLILFTDEDRDARVRMLRGTLADAERLLPMIEKMYDTDDARIVDVGDDNDDSEQVEADYAEWQAEYGTEDA